MLLFLSEIFGWLKLKAVSGSIPASTFQTLCFITVFWHDYTVTVSFSGFSCLQCQDFSRKGAWSYRPAEDFEIPQQIG